MTRAPLNADLKQALQLGAPVELVDPATNQVYYVLSAEQFRALNARGNGFELRELYPLIDAAMAEDDANDPLLDSYQ